MELSTHKFKSDDSQNRVLNQQTTVRFSSSQIQAIEQLSEDTGMSLAETTRRLVEAGLKQVNY